MANGMRLSGYAFEQTPGDSEGQGAWHAAVMGSQIVRHNSVTQQQQQQQQQPMRRQLVK